jgi:hypothetical protein
MLSFCVLVCLSIESNQVLMLVKAAFKEFPPAPLKSASRSPKKVPFVICLFSVSQPNNLSAKQLINDNMHDGTYYQLNTVNYDGFFHTWDSFKIEKILVGQQLGFYMNFLTIFIVLNIILLTVLLFVTINSVIDDLVGVILMFKALGYKTSQINFMICGSYIMASLVIFVVSYFIMQLVYYFATNLI